MNNPDNHIDSWSNTDVQKYLKGELSAREMHALEKLALDDPFLADALEGLQTSAGPNLQQDLSELRTRLDARVTEKRKTIVWPFFRVAAAIILLVGLGYTVFYSTHDQKHKLPAPATATIPAPPAAKDQAPPVAVNKTPAPAAPSAKPKTTRKTVISVPKTQTPTSEYSVAENTRLQPSKPQTIVADSITYRPNFQDLVTFSGRVLDLNRRPLAGANLMYKSNNFGTVTNAVTDQKGYFNLYIPQKDTPRQLIVAMTGYEETQYALNTEDRKGNTIYLRPSPVRLDEVVVSGIGAKRKEYLAAPPSDDPETLDSLWLNTAPAMGRIAYLDYLATARKTLSVDTAIHGTESISFLVDKKGALTEFKIERSLSPAHDAGVIRLITEGPTWQMIHGRKARALVNVTFP